MRLVNKKVIKETKDVYCGTVHNDFHGFFVNDGKLVHNCLQNEWAGAQAFNSVDTLLAPFVKVEDLSYKEVKQCIQSLVYHLNTSSRWGSQPVFSNFTLDWTVPNDLAELNCIVGGEEQDFKYKDCKREMDMINKAFMEVMIEGDADGRCFSYPIPTYSITKDFDWDENIPNNKLLFEMTAKYGIPYFSNYINSDLSPDSVRAMCPLHKDESVLIRDNYSNEFHISKIGNIYNDNKKEQEYDIVLNGEIKKARLNKFNDLDFYKVTTINGYSVVLSGNHLNLVLDNKIKRTDELSEDDYLPFNITVLDGNGLTYEDGFMVGAFLGDGSLKDDYGVVYSLNRDSKADVLSKIIDLAENKYGAKVKLYDVTTGVGSNGCVNVSIISRYLRGLISEYVSGKALDKELNVKCITRSIEFRKGIVDGYMKTDGGNRNRIYTASKKAVDSISTLFASLGTPCRITVDNRDRSETLSDNPIYTIRPYSVDSKLSCMKDVYIKKDGYMWFKIQSIEKMETGSKIGYCFEVLDDETPFFMLPSGLVTHNCRLRLDLRELRRKSGGYFGSGDNTGCYDDKTEILTSNRGWVKFEELSMSDLLYTRTEDGKLEIHNPSKLFKYRYDGDLIHFNNDRFDMLVTPNHNMAYIDKHTGIQKTVRADEYKHTIHGIPRKSVNTTRGVDFFTLPEIKTEWIQNNGKHTIIDKPMQINMNDFLQFLGLFISEGSTDNEDCAKSHGYRVFITQSKSFGRLYIKDVLDRLPFNYNTYDDKFIITNKQLWTYLRENVGTSSYTVRVPRYFLNNCSSHQLFILLDAMIVGDGSVNKNNGQITYYSVSKGLIDDVQELSMLCGFAICGIRERVREDRSSINGRKIGSKVGFKCYEIAISDGNAFYVKPDKITKEDYHGYVYCCEVDNHVIMVRRNGKATWCGNSVGVVTINMPRLAYTSKTVEEFYNKLDKLMELAARSLETKRKVITQYLETGLYPYTKRYLKTFNDHFSTIGLVGMNEACLNANWLQCTIDKDNAKEFTKDVLDFMLKKCADLQERYGNLYNLEASPSEGVMHRFALHDKKDFPDIITAGDITDGAPYYTNSTHLPVSYTEDIFTALDHQDDLQTKYTSGTVFHAFLGEKLPDWKSAMMLTRKIAENYKLPYYTFSPTYSICPDHGYIKGEEWTCPECGKQTEVYSRVTGYYRAVQNFNDGKAHEFKDRKEYVIKAEQLFAPEENTFECESCKTDFTELPEPENKEEIDTEKAVRKILASTRKPMLFTTATCPNCKMAKKFITEAGFDCDILLAEDNVDLTKMYGITSAPTLIVFEDGEPQKISNVSNIRKYLEETK